MVVATCAAIALSSSVSAERPRAKRKSTRSRVTPSQLANRNDFGPVKITGRKHYHSGAKRYRVNGWRLLAVASSGHSALALWPEDFLRHIARGTGNALSNPRRAQVAAVNKSK